MVSKKSNRSKYVKRRVPRPKFSTTFVTIGIGVGMLGGLAVEVALKRPDKLIMLAGVVSGMAVASTVAGLRYWRETHLWRRSRNAARSPDSPFDSLKN